MKTLLAAFVLLAGCGASSAKVKGPDEGLWYSVECKRSMTNCYEEAGRMCPAGYKIANSGSSDHVFVAGNTIGTRHDGEMLVRCDDVPYGTGRSTQK